MAQSPLCIQCNEMSESIYHAVFECRQSKTMWLTHPSASVIGAMPPGGFKDCFVWLCENTDRNTLADICASIWACWFGRNSIIMANKQCNFVQTSASFVKMVQDYNTYAQNVTAFCATYPPASQTWRPPAVG